MDDAPCPASLNCDAVCTTTMHSISNHIADVQKRIAQAAQRRGRQRDSDASGRCIEDAIGIETIRAAAAAGIAEFGENYVERGAAENRGAARPGSCTGISSARSSRTRRATSRAISSGCRRSIAQKSRSDCRLSAPTVSTARRIDPDQYRLRTAEGRHRAGGSGRIRGATARECRGIRLRGLMAIPRAEDDAGSTAHRVPAACANLFEAARSPPAPRHWDTLSMGMTQDFEAAIAEGATMIRIGTALFGPRGARRDG